MAKEGIADIRHIGVVVVGLLVVEARSWSSWVWVRRLLGQRRDLSLLE